MIALNGSPKYDSTIFLFQVVSFEDLQSTEGDKISKPIFCLKHVTEVIKLFCKSCRVCILWWINTLTIFFVNSCSLSTFGIIHTRFLGQSRKKVFCKLKLQ